MKTIERIQLFITQKGISPRAFETAIGASNGAISKAIKSGGSIGSDTLEKIFAAFPDLDPGWLLTGVKTAHTPSQNAEDADDRRRKKRVPGSENEGKTSPTASPTASPTDKAGYNSRSSGTVIFNEKPVVYGARTPAIITVDQSGIDNILYVPVKARAGYLVGSGDPEFMETLPSFRMPGLPERTYRMFEVEGISMTPTLSDGDRVIAEWVPSLNDIRENRIHVVVSTGGVLIKRVLNRLDERGKLYLKSDTISNRADYPIMELDPAEILEVWYVRISLSGDLREPSEVYERMANLEIQQHEMERKQAEILRILETIKK